jgi:hypothetical protein
MHTHAATSAEPFSFHVNLADDWERRYLAERLGVSEETLRASTRGDDATVEEIFDKFCPLPEVEGIPHADLHRRLVNAALTSEAL